MTFDGDTVFRDGRELRCGYTTGTCAAAAAKAAASALLGERTAAVRIGLPSGAVAELEVETAAVSADAVRCTVRKDAGDDPDVTHGATIGATVRRRSDGMYTVDGGAGVGRVTRRGLDQPTGAAAINSVPRAMIADAMAEAAAAHGWEGGLEAVVDVPDGVTLAAGTFNPDLGIEGGISILGTTGIVQPMSVKAIVDTTRKEMDMLVAEGARSLLLVPGNYGEAYAESLGGMPAVRIGNYLGEALDYAAGLGVEAVLLVGNIGKLVKVAGGIMNTHSADADCRREILAAHAVAVGGDADVARAILAAATTEAALETLIAAGIAEAALASLAERIEHHLRRRTRGKVEAAAVVFSSVHGRLCDSPSAAAIIGRLGSCA